MALTVSPGFRVGWLLLALLSGLAIATLPPAFSLAVLMIVGMALAALLHPLTAFAALLVLAPLRTLIQTESALQLPLDIGQLLTVVLVGVWAFHAIIRRTHRLPLRWSAAAWPLLIFCLTGIFSLLITHAIGTTLVECFKWLTMLVVALFTLRIAGQGTWRLLLFMLVAAGLANALIGIYIYFGGSGALHLLVNGHYFRAFGTFGQPNPFGGFMGILLPLAGAGLADAVMRWRHQSTSPHLRLVVFYVVSFTAMIAALVMSWSRGAWLSIVAAALVIVFSLPRRVGRSLLALGLITGILALVWTAGLLPTSVTSRITSSTADFFAFEDMRGVDITNENYAVVERLAHWQAALNMAEANPLGVGFGNYETVYAQYRLLNWKFALGHAHNFYLNILAELGVIGLISYSIFIISCLYFAWCGRQHPSSGVRLLSVGLLGSWTYLIFHSLLDNLYVNNVFLHAGVLIGLTYWVFNQTTLSFRVEQHGYRDAYRKSES